MSMSHARMLHTMLRVSDLDRSVKFYTQVLKMRVLRTYDNPKDQFSLTFLGYGDEAETCVLELTYNYGVDHYELGNAYGHIAIGVESCEQACADIAMRGGEIIYGPATMEGLSETIAFVKDPDGYQIELVERPIEWLS